MFATKIIDNFYDNPDQIRAYALQQNFYKRSGNYPGLRSDPITQLNVDLFNYCIDKITRLYYTDGQRIKYTANSLFQWAGQEHETGWIHQDAIHEFDLAGVVYLTPDAPKNCGTDLYVPNMINITNYTVPTDPFTASTQDMSAYRAEQLKYNSQFTKIQQIENQYNRLVMYDCRQWHAQSGFFGTNKYNARLIQVVFIGLQHVKTNRLSKI